MTKIYDCFTFYNELDLLELRLSELYTTVDRFVIVESNQTFTNRPKPFNLYEQTERFKPWLDKVIYVRVTDMPGTANPWDNEHHQRNAIVRGLTRATDDDIIIISDVDEIPRTQALDYMRRSDQTVFAMRMPIFNFKFNYMKLDPDRYNVWAMATRCRVLKEITANTLRDMRFGFFSSEYQFSNNGCEVIEHAGWHFGYMGDRDFLVDKAQSFSHQEVNTPEFIAQIDPAASIAKRTSWKQDSTDRYEIVDLDNYFPKQLLDNQTKYQQYILPDPVTQARALLPAFPYTIR
jgi:Glycosyltransferase family 17